MTSTTAGSDTTVPGDPARCRCCGGAEVEIFYRVESVPVHNSLLLDTEQDARSVSAGALELGCCPSCGFIQNVAFDPDLVSYSDGYEDTQAHSPRFIEFATAVAQRFATRYGIEGADVLEIGCGKGDFLRLVCEVTASSGVGYDPAIGPGAMSDGDAQLRFVASPYGSSVVERADLVLCRHTLEHIPDVADFVAMVATTLRDQAPLTYFEVPDTLRVLRDLAFWDLYYEHCSYFTAPTMAAMFDACGIDVMDTRLDFDDQYLLLEGRPTSGPRGWSGSESLQRHAAEMLTETACFAAGVDRLRDQWNERIVKWVDGGRSIAIWGGGSKTVGFLDAVGAADAVSTVVDINPRKRGKYLPGSALRVSAPEELQTLGADVVIIMNPIYLGEIDHSLQQLDLHPELVTA